MNASLFLEVGLIAALLLLNAVFSMSEMAIVSSRKTRLQQLALGGGLGAREALRLAESPSNFLSLIQIGMTLAAVLTGALGNATLSLRVSEFFVAHLSLSESMARFLGLGIVVTVITFLSVILGELVPKRLALRHPESIASLTARPMSALARLLSPLVWTFSKATELVLRLLHLSEEPNTSGVTHEEVKAIVNQAAKEGVFDSQEEMMMDRVLSFGKKRVTSLMTQTRDMVWVDSLLPLEEQLNKILDSRFSHYPVAAGGLDHLQGTIQAKELCLLLVEKRTDLSSFLLPTLPIPETADALQVLHLFKKTGLQMGFVVDEFGSVEGLLTLKNVLEAIVGNLPAAGMSEAPSITEQRQGTWLVPGTTPIAHLKAHFGIEGLEGEEENLFRTAAGFVLHQLGRVPLEGEGFVWREWRFEVLHMDGKRIDKILMSHQSIPFSSVVASHPENPPIA